ncbi:MAG: hypothetical protein RL026_1573 [Pseudomonadota bacterium]
MNERLQGPGDFILVTGPAAADAALRERLLRPALWQRGRTAYLPRVLHAEPGVLAIGAGDTSVAVRGSVGVVGQFDLPGQGGAGGPVPAALIHAWETQGAALDPLAYRGGYAFGGWNLAGGQWMACTDLFRRFPLYVRKLAGHGQAVGTDLRLLAACTAETPALNLAALYDLLNLYYVPTPLTLYSGINKLPPATLMDGAGPDSRERRYWMPDYPADIDVADTAATAGALRGEIETAVLAQREGASAWGTFLSGGTDSSSISGILARARGATGPAVRSFSIGFAEEGYDELGYCDIAARYYGLDASREVVSATDTLALVDLIVSAYDEPAGNASSIPTMACTRLAKDSGIDIMIGGDGGDEIFGGNERYLKDAIMQRFHVLPKPLKALFRGGARLLPGDSHFINRVRNFIKRGSLPNPDRFYTDDAFASEWYDSLLTPAMRAAVPRDTSLEVLRETYAKARAKDELHRLMFIDLERTIADNDIVKVTRAARANGIFVRFPYLERGLVEHTGRLPVDCKLRSGEKRFLFRRAVADLLPAEILAKKKQGFGLPVSVWFRKDTRYVELLQDTVCSPGSRLRSLVEPAAVRTLLGRHQSGAWEHGAELWALLMIERWLEREGVRP